MLVERLIDKLEKKGLKPNVLLFQECRMPIKSEAKIPGYNLAVYVNTKPSVRGTAIYVKSGTSYTQLTVNSQDICGVTILGDQHTVLKKPIDIWNVYNAPTIRQTEINLPIIQDIIANSHNPTLMAGDMNTDLTPGARHDAGTRLRTQLLEWDENGTVEILNSYTKPTRISARRSTIIDIAITKNITTGKFALPIIEDISDHLPLIIGFKSRDNEPESNLPPQHISYKRDEKLLRN